MVSQKLVQQGTPNLTYYKCSIMGPGSIYFVVKGQCHQSLLAWVFALL